jgi:hypothetical protein
VVKPGNVVEGAMVGAKEGLIGVLGGSGDLARWA